jgi:outer membrane receptor for ferrienterochelin and colicin
MIKGILFLASLIITVLWSSSDLYGQNDCDRSTIIKAEKDYSLGKFENTLTLLDVCLERGEFNIDLKEDAYRLKAWTYIALDSIVKAQNAVVELLSLNPSYSSRSDDPLSFRYMVSDIRLGFFDMQVTSVSKKPENIKETPATVMVITEDDIKQRGYIDLEAMFSDLPGFDVSRTFGNTYSNIYQRGYRSNNTDRTLFLIDGVEENDLWSNVAYISRQYPISNIKRVEVVYGPASTMYGANAFLGVINVITKKPEDILADKPFHVSGEIGGGNFNTKYGELTLAARKNNISFITTGRLFTSKEIDLSGYEEFDYNPSDYDKVDYASILGISNPDPSVFNSSYYDLVGDSAILTPLGVEAARNLDKEAITKGGPNNTPIQYSNLSDHYFISSKLDVNHFSVAYQFWKLNHSTGNYGTDNSRLGADYGGVWSQYQSFINATYSRDLNDKLTFTNIAQYRINSVADNSRTVTLHNYSNGSLDGADLLTDSEPFYRTTHFYQLSRQFRNELKLNYQPFRGLDIVSGIEVRNSAIQGNYRNLTVDGIFSEADTLNVIEFGSSSLDSVGGGNNFSVYDYGFYLQASYDIHPIVNLTVGGRFDYNKVRVSGGYGNIFNPRIALVVTPGKMIMKVIFAQAFKDATNFQKYSTAPTRLFNNPKLQPENVNNIETSIGYKFNKRLFIDATAYYSNYSGAIAAKLVEIDGVSSFRNDDEGSLKIFGIQAAMNYKMSNYSVYGNYSFVRPKNELLDANGVGTETFVRIGDIASHHLNLGVNALYFEHLNINLRSNFVSRRPVGPGTSVSSNTLGDFPSFFLLNGAVTYKNIFPGLNVQISVNNLLNTKYSDPGIRSADGITRPYRIPQRGLFTMFKLYYDL